MKSDEARRWIFLRGLGRHSKHWGEFVAEFKKEFPLWSVELLDLAGNGTEVDRESFLRIDSYVKDLRGRSKSAEMGPVSILAISMGAMIAAQWALTHPEEIQEIVMINTSSGKEAKFFERLQPQNYLKMLQVFRKRMDLVFREEAILEMTAGSLPHLQKVAELQSHLVPTTPDNFLRQMLAASQFKFSDKKPDCDVLILAAKGDTFVNPVCSQRLADRWGAQLKLHPRGDHDLPLVDPHWVIEQLRDS